MTYTKDNFRQIFQQPFNANEWQQMLRHYFQATELRAEPERIDGTTDDEQGYYLGAIDTTDSYRIGLFYYQILHGNVARKRVGLRNLVKSFVNPNWGEFDAALVVFNSGELWRLSFVSDIKGESTAPKRYTYVFGESDNYYNTPVGRFDALQRNGISFENIKDAFSVERLNKDFFNGYRDRYKKFLNYLNDNTKENRDYVKKLLGRLVFLQFLQKKGWMGVPVNNQGWTGGDKFYLNHLIESYEGNDRLLSDVLEPLFFNTLNERRANDLVDSRLGENVKIPYLNGGLFDKDELDKRDIDFPYNFFKELMDFFAMYNFTIDENDPEDSEIGIDPEMLGHIFENLLEDNKEKGAFYTPKEIVQYMSKESVVQYLKGKTPEELHTAIDSLIKQRVVESILQNRENARLVNKVLSEVKVCDPAIGSGAFPMGVLNVLFDCRHLLYGFIGKNEDFSYAKVKREIIQNNIYGVDIEKGAVDVARLRFWLALVVDETQPEPLPNLDFKIMQGNSLLEQFEGLELSNLLPKKNKDGMLLVFDEEAQLQAILHEKQLRYFSATNHEEKQMLRMKIVDVVKKLIIERTQGNKSISEKLKDFDLSANDQFFLWHTWFADVFEKGGFDIVIGNPPYLRIQGIRESNPKFADYLSKHYESAIGSFDLYVTFAERGLGLINQKGVVNYIMPTKWTNSAFGKGLRRLVSKTKSASKIINFGAYQVFNASTYTGLQWFSPNSEYLKYIELDRDLSSNDELKQYLDSLNDDHSTIIKSEKLNESQWVLTNNAVSAILNRLEQHPRRIKDVFDKIFQGLATSKDDVYFIYDCRMDEEFVIGESKQLGRKVQIEKGLVKPLLKGEDVHRYDTIKTDRYVVFPYKIQNGKAILYSEIELSEQFPHGYAYLKECESVLREREKGRFNVDGEWFQFGRKQGILFAEKEKLVAPEISLGGNFAYDKNGEFYSTTKIYGYIKKESIKESYKFWMALFNSRLFWFFIQNTGYVLRGGYYTFKTDYVNPFPVPQSISKEAEKAITILVDYIVYLNDKSNSNILSHTSNKRISSHIEEIVDMVFYGLYFEQHMKDKQIDVVSFLNTYTWDNGHKNIQKEIESFYLWYQQSENPIRQRIMLLETRSKDLLYPIHTSYTL